ERLAPLSVAGYQRMVARAGEAAGFLFQISSHVLRHSCGYKLANDGRDTRSIQHYLAGEIEKSAPADANGRPFAGNGKGPPGGRQNNLGPIVAIQTIPSYAQWVPFPTSCTCYRRTLVRRSYPYSERFRSTPRTHPPLGGRLRMR